MRYPATNPDIPICGSPTLHVKTSWIIPPITIYMLTQGSVMQTMGSAGIKE